MNSKPAGAPGEGSDRSRKRSPSREEVARYVGDMTEELGRLASGSQLDLLAYYLSLANLEAKALLDGPTEEED